MDRKEIKEAAALFNAVKTMVEEVETPVSFLNEAEEVITVDLGKVPRDKKGLEDWEKEAPLKIFNAVNAIEFVRVGDEDAKVIDDAMLAEYLPKLVQDLYMEVKKAQVPAEEEKPAKAKVKKEKKEKVKKEKPVKEKVKKPAKAKKTEKSAKMTRIESVCQAIRIGGTLNEIAAEANKIYVENGGPENFSGTLQYASIITSALKHLDFVSKQDDGKIQLQ